MKSSAKYAIKLLDTVRQQLGAQYVAYWALPNVILTLSGARAFCDGVFWDDDRKDLLNVWRQEISKSIALIKNCTGVVWSEAKIHEARPGEKYTGYELILEQGLQYVLSQTHLLTTTTFDQLKGKGSANDISQILVADLRSQQTFKDYSDEHLNHVAFGILVGYPDKAIIESVLKWEDNDPFAEPMIGADIRGAPYYICPQPIYSYPRSLVNNSEIQVHERAWSSILRDYYLSEFHTSLEKDQSFRAKMEELGNLR